MFEGVVGAGGGWGSHLTRERGFGLGESTTIDWCGCSVSSASSDGVSRIIRGGNESSRGSFKPALNVGETESAYEKASRRGVERVFGFRGNSSPLSSK